ncbi:ChaB family protein [Pseudonocardia xinjiangensis]|uniref:Cation transport regulator ChaB n=1 Tax=Pseudonocardia xinjiangensis TaxID=75289 RepID=A0ABX1R8J6_9PSEU|nr:ChaB family protein [Pseudonocardia xinjiangensis]NMH76695.1 cation transport regulator ChaB [Pseudonocardia xinjiangensis]
MAGKDEVPSTVERSDDKAERTWEKTYDSAMDSYDGDGARARRTAFASLKHTHEKVGDHWEPKDGKGPSDEQAARGGRDSDLPTAGGVDANASKEHLLDVAKKLDVRGRSSMNKDELVEAIGKANNRETAKARKKK